MDNANESGVCSSMTAAVTATEGRVGGKGMLW